MRLSTAQIQRESVSMMQQQQAGLTKTQQQVASGRRILTPADDPAGAARALDLSKAAATFQQYAKNAEQATLRLSIEETVLDQASNLIQRVRELTVQANNATNDAQNRNQIAAEIEQRFDQLVQLANGTDGKGEYLFSGFSTRTEPFSRSGGEVVFQGDQGQRLVQVGPSRQLPVDHSGFDVFMKIPNGNGTFVINADADNQGTGRIATPGVVSNANQYQAETHEVRFFSNDDDEMVYAVYNSDGDQVVPDPALTDPNDMPLFVENQAIQFNGVSVSFAGEPVPHEGDPADPYNGDSFTVEPSENQSLFRTMRNLINTLSESGDRPEQRTAVNNGLLRSLIELDAGLANVLRVRAEVGGRLNAIDTEMESNEVAALDIKAAMSKVEDVDYAEAISNLNQQMMGLQASQQSYMKIQGLSLFNYL